MSSHQKQPESCTSFRDAIKRYREKHKLTQEKLAKKLFVSVDTVKSWERDTEPRKPRIETLYDMAEKLNITFDELLRGIPTGDIDACNQTGLSIEAIDNLAKIKNKHIKNPEEYRDLIPLLNMILSDENLLWELDQRVSSLISWEVTLSAIPAVDEQDKPFPQNTIFHASDMKDGIEYALSRCFLGAIKKYVKEKAPILSADMSKQELEDAAATHVENT